jgi:predicted phosphodiesterase
VYNNHVALAALLDQVDADHFYCLGDIGGFGPSPDKVFPLLYQPNISVMQGNYDHSIGNRLEDCACGYVDPRDQHFAQVSYDYTLAHTSDGNKDWLRDLPTEFRHTWGGKRVLMSHGSPRRTNEFLWESTCSDTFVDHLLRKSDCDILFVTHTGIPWIRTLDDGRQLVNVGVIGRPPNDGGHDVDYVLVDVNEVGVTVTPKKLAYDFEALAAEMRDEGLPEQFVETVLTGYWTTCLEVLPAKERAVGTF